MVVRLCEFRKSISKELLSEYKKFSLAECIEKNYEKMGVVFTKLPLKDNTRGFIDLDIGLAFIGIKIMF